MIRNTHWHRFEPGAAAAERVVVRRSPPNMDAQTVLFADKWPNLIETSSLIKAELLNRYETEHYELWKRPLDKFFYIHLGKRASNADGFALIRFLRQKIDPKEVVAGLSGYTLSDQIFPRGYQLHDLDFSYPNTVESLPAASRIRHSIFSLAPLGSSPISQENSVAPSPPRQASNPVYLRSTRRG